jgi:Fe-S cluster assembly ATP-binding protein
MLKISNLQASVEGKPILHGIDLDVKKGEVHAIMGPNGSGKSTLAQVLSGNEAYEHTGGTAELDGVDLMDLAPEERACEGLFMAFQYPVEIPGVNNTYFLKSALNAVREYRNEETMDAMDFMTLVRSKMKALDVDEKLVNRPVNAGFSGGEKKRNEVLQLLVLDPKLAILDETDSGLDIDALRIVADGVNQYRNENNGVVVITHYQRLLDYIQPDFVHILYQGRIVKSGDKSLALELEERGYDWIKDDAPETAAV